MNIIATANATSSVDVYDRTTRSRVVGSQVRRRLSHANFRRMASKLTKANNQRRQRNATARSLHRLDDHMLRDIGIKRDEIDYFARQTVAQD